MKILQMPDPLHEYLLRVVESYSKSGIHPEEGFALYKLWEIVTNPQHISEEQIDSFKKEKSNSEKPNE